jgi:hypothetical protein
MGRKIYLGIMILPVYFFNSTSAIASSSFSPVNYSQSMPISQNITLNNADFPQKLKVFSGRDHKDPQCLRSGDCKY